MKTTTQYSWNLGVEREITPKLFGSATYVGSKLIHVWTAIELNPDPDPGKWVYFGQQSWEEMGTPFLGFVVDRTQ